MLPITGALQSLPGPPQNRTVDAEGTVEPVDQIDRDVRIVVRGAAPGTILGVLGLELCFRYGWGLLGGGLDLGKALFTRSDPISLPMGAQVEMVLPHPLLVQIN